MTNFLDITIGKMSIADISVVMIYLIMCLIIGVNKATKIKDIKEYALGYGGITTSGLALTIYATWLGAATMLSAIEWVSTVGVVLAIAILCQPLKWPITAWIFGRNIEQFRDCLTSGDVMSRLYGKWGKRISDIAFILDAVAIVSAQATALGYLMHYFFETPITIGILIGLIVVTGYSMAGGIRAVILTDIMQFGVFYIMFPVICGTLLYHLGGWDKMTALVPPERWEFNLQKEGYFSMFLAALLWAILPMAKGPYIQRFLISMDAKQIVRTLKIVTIIDLTVVVMLCLLGIIVASQLNGSISGPEAIWHVLSNNVPFLTKGLIVAGASAVIMSTADSFLNNAAVLIVQDILKPIRPTINNRTELALARYATLLLGIMAFLLAVKGKGIMHLIWIAISFSHPLLTIPLCAGFLGFRTNYRSFIAATAVAIISTAFGAYLQGKFGALSTFAGLIGSAIGLFGMHYFQKALGTLTRVAEEEKRWLEGRREITLTSTPIVTPAIESGTSMLSEFFSPLATMYREFCQTLGNNIWQFMDNGVAACRPNYSKFAVVGFIYALYPLLLAVVGGYGVVSDEYQIYQTEITLRMLSAFGCLGLAIHNFTREKEQNLNPYWYGLLLVSLPLTACYSYLINPGEPFVIAGSIMAIFMLALFVDWVRFLTLALSGLALGGCLFTFSLLTSSGQLIYQSHALAGLFVYLVIATAAALAMRYSQELGMRKLKVQDQALAASIAHELRSPLDVVSAISNQIRELMLKQNAEEENKAGKQDSAMPSKMLELMSNIAESIDGANNLIDIILGDLKNKPIDPTDFSCLKVEQVLPVIVRKYGYREEEEKAKVKLELSAENNFAFKVVVERFVLIIYNLMKNALYYLRDYPDSVITIGTESKVRNGKEYNVIYVHDTGPGIPAHIIPKLFGDFFSAGKKEGTGLGLSFCKRNMLAFGGDAICESEFGKWTKFSLFFPKLSEEEIKQAEALAGSRKIMILGSGGEQGYEAIERLEKEIAKDLPYLGFQLFTNRLDALKLLKKSKEISPFHLVLLNLEEGQEENSLKAAREIRRFNQEIPIIAYGSPAQYSLFAKEIGANLLINGYLRRPEEKEAKAGQGLFRALSKWLVGYRDNFNYLEEDYKARLVGRKIILADDSKLNRLANTHLLRSLGLEVSEASDGQELLALYQNSLDEKGRSCFDLILTDINMPPYNGDEAAKKIRNLEDASQIPLVERIPIIALSGDGQREDIWHFFECQMTDYAIKGGGADLLVKLVANYLDKQEEATKERAEVAKTAEEIEDSGSLA